MNGIPTIIDNFISNMFSDLIKLNFCFIFLGFYVPFTYLPKAAIEQGISRENAAFLLSIIGNMY